jgi:TRAP-type transport system small permease protein
LRRAATAAQAVENAALGVLVAGIVVVVAAQVFFRYVLHRPLSWSREAATILLVWAALTGMAVAVRDRRHVALLLFEDRLPPAARRITHLVQLGAMAAFMVVLLVGGISFTTSQLEEHTESGIPLWIAYLSVPVGAALSLAHIAAQLPATVKGRPPGPAEGAGRP